MGRPKEPTWPAEVVAVVVGGGVGKRHQILRCLRQQRIKC